MKSLVIFSLSFLLALTTFAQENDTLPKKENVSPYRTVFHKNKNTLFSGYFTILNELSFPSTNKIGVVYSIGGEAGMLLNQRIMIGGYSLVSVAPRDLENTFLDNTDVRLLQIGGNVGFKIAPNKPIHLTVGSRVGYTGLQWFQWDNNYTHSEYENYRLAQRIDGWSVMPHADVEMNMFSWLQFKAGVGYRMAWGGKWNGYDLNKDLRQATFNIGVSFGYFK